MNNANELRVQPRKEFRYFEPDDRFTWMYNALVEMKREVHLLCEDKVNIRTIYLESCKEMDQVDPKLSNRIYQYWKKLEEDGFKPYELIKDIKMTMRSIDKFEYLPVGKKKDYLMDVIPYSFRRCKSKFEMYMHLIGIKDFDEIRNMEKHKGLRDG